MSLIYLIDAYNVIRSTAALDQGSLDQQRERLLDFIEKKRPQGASRNSVVVVFDGRPGRYTPRPRPGIQIRFSRDLDADTLIKAWVDELPNPALAVVVTNDRSIQRWVRGAKARILSCNDFLHHGHSLLQPNPAKKLDPQTVARINQELEETWL